LRRHLSVKRKLEKIMVKLLRAAGGCLGIKRRRRTRVPAKSFGEPERGVEPEMSEWGNPVEIIIHHPYLNP
jgi:hypothetical protein